MPFAPALAFDLTVLLDASWTATAALAAHSRPARVATQTEILSGADAVARARPAWRHVENAGGAATPFQTCAAAQGAAKAHLDRGDTPRVIIVHDGGEPVVVFPTVVTRWSGLATLRFLGDPLIQYGDIVAAPGASPAHVEAAWRAATDPAVAQLAYLRKVRDDARIAPLLARTAWVAATHQAPFVEVRRLSTMNARDLRELRRTRRRLGDIGAVAFEVLRGEAALAATREALSIKSAWLDMHALPSSVVGDAGWESAIFDMAGDASSPLRVARLTVGGRTAASEVGLVHGGRWCAFLGALSPDFVRNGPGHVQMAETIAHCRDNGVDIYDLLAPTEAYKRRIAHEAATVRDFAAPLTAAGWAGVTVACSIPVIKSVAARIPTGLRRMVLRRA